MQMSQRQQQTIASAMTVVAGLVIATAILGLLWVLAAFVQRFSEVLLPLAVAGIAALVFQPYYELLHERLGLARPVAVAALFLSVLVPVGLFFTFFGVVIVNELVQFFDRIPVWWSELQQFIAKHLPEVKTFLEENEYGKRLAQMLEGLGPMAAATLEYIAANAVQAGTSVAGWTAAVFGWAVAPVYFVFFLILPRQRPSQLDANLPFLKESTRKDVVFLINEFVSIIVSFFRGQFIIAFLQGVLLSVGFSVVGLEYGLVLGLLLGFLNVIPYLGSMVGLSITLPLAYFQTGGGLSMVIGVLVVLGIVQSIEGYVLTPKIMGDRTGLHPVAIIFAIFFWGTALGGIMGMILAIPLTAFLVVAWRLVREKYIPEMV